MEIDLYLGLNAHVGDISSAITLCVAYVLHSGGKNHTPHQGALIARKEYYASAEQSVVHRLRLGPGLDVRETEGNLDAPMSFPRPVQVI